MGTLTICAALVVGCMLLAGAAAPSAVTTPAPVAKTTATTPAIDPELHRQLIETLHAQADYYKRPIPPSGGMSTWISPVVSGVAALVAFATLLVNYWFNLGAKRDNQFYEALKRFGDKDSPAVRVSAAVLLSDHMWLEIAGESGFSRAACEGLLKGYYDLEKVLSRNCAAAGFGSTQCSGCIRFGRLQ